MAQATTQPALKGLARPLANTKPVAGWARGKIREV